MQNAYNEVHECKKKIEIIKEATIDKLFGTSKYWISYVNSKY